MPENPKKYLLSNPEQYLEGMSIYIEGKMKRYYLLFAVNGGSFAIAKLMSDYDTIGGLSLKMLAVGAAIFTILMWIDIYTFGQMMRKEFFGDTLVFKNAGKAILTALCSLLIIAWLLAAFFTPNG